MCRIYLFIIKIRKFIFAQQIKKVSYQNVNLCVFHNVIPIQTYDFCVNLFVYHQNKEIHLQILYCKRCRATIRLNDLFVFFKYGVFYNCMYVVPFYIKILSCLTKFIDKICVSFRNVLSDVE